MYLSWSVSGNLKIYFKPDIILLIRCLNGCNYLNLKFGNLAFHLLTLQLMYRKEDIPLRIRFAVILLVALLMLSMQQYGISSFFSDAKTLTIEVKKQLTIKPSLGSASNLGIVHDESQLAFALVLTFSFLLVLFPDIKGSKVIRFTPVPLSRNFCCIVPKGP